MNKSEVKKNEAEFRQIGQGFKVCTGFLVAWTLGSAVQRCMGKLANSNYRLDCAN